MDDDEDFSAARGAFLAQAGAVGIHSVTAF